MVVCDETRNGFSIGNPAFANSEQPEEGSADCNGYFTRNKVFQ
jgi:hypothetical protein